MLPSAEMQQPASGAQQSLQGPENEDNLADFGAAASRNILFVDGPAESIVLSFNSEAGAAVSAGLSLGE